MTEPHLTLVADPTPSHTQRRQEHAIRQIRSGLQTARLMIEAIEAETDALLARCLATTPPEDSDDETDYS